MEKIDTMERIQNMISTRLKCAIRNYESSGGGRGRFASAVIVVGPFDPVTFPVLLALPPILRSAVTMGCCGERRSNGS